MSSREEEKADTSVCFPSGLKVLVVDADAKSLDEITNMSLQCGYKVRGTTEAIEALSIIRETRSKFDIVIIDINIRDMDPFEFIKILTVKMDMPLVVVSAHDEYDTVLKGLSSGACDYLLKPIHMENIKFIWKHVIRDKKHKAMEQPKLEASVENCQKALSLDGEIVNATEKENGIIVSSNSGGVEKEDDGIHDNIISQKKQRIVWTQQLHEKFVIIVNNIGVKNAVPKKILEMMNHPGLTRENVASHLQKYRMYLRKMDESMQQKRQMQSQAINVEFNPQMYSYNSQNQINLDKINLQQLAQKRAKSFGYISPLDQISPQNYGVPESRFGLQTTYNVRHEILSPTISPEADQIFPINQFSGFRIGDNYGIGNLDSSLAIERPSKYRKPSPVESNEALSDALWRSTTTFPSTENDLSTWLSQFTDSELASFLKNFEKRDVDHE